MTLRSVFSSLALGLIVMFGAPAKAFVELNAFYFSETEATAASSASNRTFLEGTVGYRIDKSGQYLVGWGVASHSQAATATTSTTYTSLQMGPRFLWMIDKAKNWSFGFAYYIVSTATYDNGTSAEKWKGTAMHFDGGYNLPVNENVFLAVRLNYSSASFTERLVGSTTYSEVAYTKTFIYPSLAALYIF